MPEIVWHRSLYWRIALGFVALLATLLAIQGVVFLWLTGRASELLPGRSPAEYAQTIAADLGVSLAERQDLDIDEYLNNRYQTTYRPFAVVTLDGRTVVSRKIAPPPGLSRAVFARLMGEAGLVPPRASGGGGPGGRGRGGFDRGRGGGRGGPPGQAILYAPVQVEGKTFAMVGVTSDPRPLLAAIRDLGPALALVAIGLLSVGTAIGALLIFRPTHRRLRSLQQAARAIGQGQEGVRAVPVGGDEVAMLAQAFNEMAGGLEQRTQALVAADESRRQLLADVSHELMTPLAAIRGYVETMSMPDLALDEPTRQRYLSIVYDETARMEHIIGELLDLARVEGGGGVWKQEPVRVASLFERVLHRHDPALRAKGITLERSISDDASVVAGDSNRLEQALQNLATNALRHTPEGGRIRLASRRVVDGVELSVEDTGSGIPADHLARVFDRFYKVDESRTGTEFPSGSGLGLSIVQAIIRRHGGRIGATNSPGGGARFEIVLPDRIDPE